MPPGDTLILNSLDDLPDSIRQFVDSLMGLSSYQPPGEPKGPNYPFPEWVMFLFIFSIAAITAYGYIIRPAGEKKRKIKRIFSGDPTSLAAIKIQYDQWLNKYNPYYNSLIRELKERFLKRTIEFKGSKEFRFHYMQPEEQAAVLISGAAVQLTFGLKKFLVEYFPVINVIKKEYSYTGGDNWVEGHVHITNRSINISWNSFISDYEDYTDSENVGLHEIAHAISYDFLYGFHENKHPHFKKGHEKYIKEAAPLFRELRQGKNDILDDYGCLNPEEFWAVCIETFFENSLIFRDKMPGLYAAICEVLNQDPLSERKLLDHTLI